ncbi:MAG: bacteriohemerythrin [Desulfamplus sp.]|nr:bacteriohemerythrin [Desulfamplus sp.]
MMHTEKKIDEIRVDVINSILSATLFLVPLGITGMIVRASNTGWLPTYFLNALLALIIFVLALFRNRLNFQTKSIGLIVCLMMLGSIAYFQNGLLASSPIFFLTSIGLATVFFGKCGVVAVVCSSLIMTAVAGFFIVSSGSTPSYDVADYLTSPAAWISTGINLLILGTVFIYALAKYNASLTKSLADTIASEMFANQTQKVALVAMADLAEYRDQDTGEHVLRVARMTHEIARTLIGRGVKPDNYGEDFLKHIGVASILHDVGKVGIPDGILLKPGKLTPEERSIIELHPTYGGSILQKATRMLSDSPQFKLAAEIANFHHEHWDGAGYPEGLRGTDIPLSARIVTIADVYDALTSKRPYKEPWTTEKALAYIRDRSGSQFDPAVVEAFFEVQTMRSHAPTVKWSDQIAIGHPALDQDHRILLELVNQIANPENTKDRAAIKFVIDEVVNYTYFHFNREEQFMAAAGYPDLDRHSKIHASMVAEVKLLQQRFDEQGENIGSELSQFLNEWLINHIMKIDKQYGPYVVNISNEALSKPPNHA